MERWLKESLRQSTGSLMVRLMEQQSKKSQMVLWKGSLMAQCAMVYAHLHHMSLHHNCFSEFDISFCQYTHSSVILQSTGFSVQQTVWSEESSYEILYEPWHGSLEEQSTRWQVGPQHTFAGVVICFLRAFQEVTCVKYRLLPVIN